MSNVEGVSTSTSSSVNQSRLAEIPTEVQSSSEAYERCMREMMAIPVDRFITINVDVGAAIEVGLIAASNVLPLRAELMLESRSFDARCIDNLELYARALFEAHSLYLRANQAGDPLSALIDKGVALREKLYQDTLGFVAHGVVAERDVPTLTRSTSYRSVAFELNAIRSFVASRWEAVKGGTFLTREQLDEAERVANDIINTLAARTKSAAHVAAASEMRVRAFTLFVEAYEEVRLAVAWLRRKEGDAASLTPSIYSSRRSRGASKSERNGATGDEEGPSTAPETRTTEPATPVSVTRSTPDNGPFTS